MSRVLLYNAMLLLYTPSLLMLQFENLSLRRGSSALFEGANIRIHPGQKVGITGANGAGKSSLFSLIKNELHADVGSISIPKHWAIAHVSQETPPDPRAAIEYVLDGDTEWRELDTQLQQDASSPNLHARYEEIGGYTARARAAQLLHGLGFKKGEEQQAVSDFSGGWRVRLNVARALMCRSDLLLLDEPTNHLDLDAVLWLERWLIQYQGTLLIIAHDRDFLDSLITHTLHIEQQKALLYKGNYSAFEKIRAEQLANQQSQFEKQQRERAHMEDFVRRFRAKATKARQAQSRLKALQRMENIVAAHIDSPFSFSIPRPEKEPNPLLRLEGAHFAYNEGQSNEKCIIDKLDLRIAPGERIGLIGPNGAGKSTLIKILAGEIAIRSEQRLVAPDLKIGYFAQHQLEQLHPEHTPVEHLKQLDEDITDQQTRNYLGSFGFAGDKAKSKVGPFSGGEKSRLALALLCYQQPNLLLLDEPTNHLDLEMRQSLALALQNYSGAVIIVSHDRHLLRVNSDQLILVYGGKARYFDGDLDDYPSWIAEQARLSDNTKTDKAINNNHSAASRKEQKRLEAERRQQLQPITKRIKAAEKVMDECHTLLQKIEAELADNNLYNDDNKDKLKQLLSEQGHLQQQHDQAENAWLDASEEYETLKKRLNDKGI